MRLCKMQRQLHLGRADATPAAHALLGAMVALGVGGLVRAVSELARMAAQKVKTAMVIISPEDTARSAPSECSLLRGI